MTFPKKELLKMMSPRIYSPSSPRR